jgi:integrase
MRRRYQKGSVKPVKGKWIAQWRENGHKRKRTLGQVGKMTKSEAKQLLEEIVAPINARTADPTPEMTFGVFVSSVYLPFYSRKWKGSTRDTNEQRIRLYLIEEFGSRMIGSFHRDDLQDFLDCKGAEGFSFSTVAHLRWDLRQIFRMAAIEDFISKSPAELLFVPRQCPRSATRTMTAEQVMLMFSVLGLRELLIAKLAVIAGMRPGEIFGLKWARLSKDYADIVERVYRGEIDSPKTFLSIRRAALANGLQQTIEQWRAACGGPMSDAWVFPSEKGTTPLGTYNCWRRWFKPRLRKIGLGWVNFQVMRRTHSCIADDNHVDPQVRANQMGHTVDVNQNVYTRSSMDRRLEAVNAVEQAVTVN